MSKKAGLNYQAIFYAQTCTKFYVKDPFSRFSRAVERSYYYEKLPALLLSFSYRFNNRPANNLLLGKNENCHTVFIGEQYYRNQSRAIELKYSVDIFI